MNRPKRAPTVATRTLRRAAMVAPTRQALAVAALSCAFWLTWNFARYVSHASGTLNSAYSDHYSHLNAARLFPRAGLDLWRRPVDHLYRPLTAAELHRVPEDIRQVDDSTRPHQRGEPRSHKPRTFHVPGWPVEKPLVVNWPGHPRPYPPGVLLLVSPAAIAYQWTALSFSAVNRLTVGLLLVYAHLAIFFLLRAGLEERWRDGVTLLSGSLLYSEAVHWTLQGFYDAVVLAPLILCARFLRDGRGVDALLAYSVAAVLHYRSFFLAPWAVYGAYLILSERQWCTWTRRSWISFVGAVLLSVISLFSFAVLWPAPREFPIENVASLFRSELNGSALAALAVILCLVGTALVRARAWLDLAVLIWFAIMIVGLSQAYPWHVTILAAWLAAPVIGTRTRPEIAIDARVLAFLFIALLVFNNPLAPYWIESLFR